MRSRRALVCLVAAGAVLRIVPIWFGLPFDRARPDEETAIAHALAIVAGDPNPHFFHWPSLTFYAFAAALGAAPAASVNAQYVIARGFVAAAGTATIPLLYLMVRPAADEAAALTAAFLLAVAPLHVRESHFAMTDVVMTLLTTAALAVRTRAAGRPGAFARAGALGGLAASTKYTAAAILSVLAVPPYSLAAAAAFGAAFVLGFIAGTPYAVLDFHSFAAGFGFDVAHLSTGQAFVDLGRGWSSHLLRSLPYGAGVPVFGAGLAGAAIMVRRRCAAALPAAAFCVALYAALALGRTVFFRYVLPMIPFVCASAAVAIVASARWMTVRFGWRRAVVPLAFLVALPSTLASLQLDRFLARTDTRVLAGQWLAARVLPDESIYDAGGDYAGVNLRGVTAHIWSVETFDESASAFRDSGGRLPDWLVLPESPLAYGRVPPALRQLAADRYTLVETVAATQGDTSTSVYDAQDAFFLPIAGFGPVVRPGPTIRIYQHNARTISNAE